MLEQCNLQLLKKLKGSKLLKWGFTRLLLFLHNSNEYSSENVFTALDYL